jgi:hypothetical protein
MNTIRRLCQRCIVLENGKIIYDGDVEHAIALYMDRSAGQNQVDLDLTQMAHNTVDEKPALEMTHLTLPDKVTATYEEGEPLTLDLQVRVRKPMDKVRLRITLRTDTDAGLGTAWSDEIDFSQGTSEGLEEQPGETSVDDEPTGAAQGQPDRAEQYRGLRFSMNMDSIAKGVFYVSIGLYSRDELGRALMVDHITRAFKIEVLGSPIWYTSAYGNVALPRIELLETEVQ